MKINKSYIFNKIYSFILGEHPRNTIFSFNYHNVKHIVSFMTRNIRHKLKDNNYIIVDIGAGRSPYYYLFSEKASRYIAVDMKESLPTNEMRTIEQICGIAEKIPLENNIADIVICNQVLEHIEDPIEALKEINRILKPNGILIGSVPHISPIHLEPYDYWRFTELGINKLLIKSGFSNIYAEGNGGAHSAASLMICMDWMLSKRKENEIQKFYQLRALSLFPLVGIMNILSIILDKIIGDKKRTPSNMCFIARKNT